MAKKTGAEYYITMSSDTLISLAGQQAPRPSDPLAKSTDNIYYLDRYSGKITYNWSIDDVMWTKIN